MERLLARPVFYVEDAERALSFYTQSLGFTLDWNYAPNGRAFVFQVSMLGFMLIINETESSTTARSGRGRVFIGLENNQLQSFEQHVKDNNLEFEVVAWGEPTLLIRDPEGNWLTFWLPEEERSQLRVGSKWPPT